MELEPKKKFSDPFDQLVADTLHEQLGAPPSQEVWSRIAQEVADPTPAPPLVQKAAPGWAVEWLLSCLRGPIFQSAFVTATALLLIFVLYSDIPPKAHEFPEMIDSTEMSIQSTSSRPQNRPLPQSDLRIMKEPSSSHNIKHKRLVTGDRRHLSTSASVSVGNIALNTLRATPK
ncbi:MAG: hypothetical protein ACPGWR_25625 [Ardenticatenaceae bacterium]